MKQLVIDILMKLAKMDVDTKELTAQVEAQSLLIAALLLTAGKDGSASISENIQNAVLAASQSGDGFTDRCGSAVNARQPFAGGDAVCR